MKENEPTGNPAKQGLINLEAVVQGCIIPKPKKSFVIQLLTKRKKIIIIRGRGGVGGGAGKKNIQH